MRISGGVEVFRLARNFMGSQGIIHPVLIWDDQDVILVDTGEHIHLKAVQEAMEQAGVPFSRLNKIIMTHHDIDHIGNLPNLLDAAQQDIEVIAHETEKPYVEGTKPMMKLNVQALKEKLQTLPQEEEVLRGQIELMLTNPPKGKVDTVVTDMQVLPYCGGITVIHTPGHTPGHISLYLNSSKILITGDAIVSIEGKLRKPLEQFTPDMETAVQSLKRFVKFDVDMIVCYHGGVYTGDANRALAELAAQA